MLHLRIWCNGIKVTLRNSGLGPAIIQKFEILLDGVPAPIEQAGGLYQLLARTAAASLVEERCSFAHLSKGHTVSKDEIISLADIAFWGPFDSKLEAELGRFHVRVTYQSAYGESYCYDSRDHQS